LNWCGPALRAVQPCVQVVTLRRTPQGKPRSSDAPARKRAATLRSGVTLNSAPLGVMTRVRIAIVCSVVLVIGLLAGGSAVAWFYGHFLLSQSLASSAAAGVGNKVVILKSLKAGESNKVAVLLETELDGDLVILGLVPESTIDDRMSRAIARAADYRTAYPYKSGDPVVDSAVSDVLSKHRLAKSQGK